MDFSYSLKLCQRYGMGTIRWFSSVQAGPLPYHIHGSRCLPSTYIGSIVDSETWFNHLSVSRYKTVSRVQNTEE